MPPLQHDDVTAWGLEILGQSACDSRHALPLMAGDMTGIYSSWTDCWRL
ncbi:hypothetical protein [Halomonas sp. A3H3]|nr:hypothetical protein [Halomonas sp. A3H3]